jgi:hypothetical protein
MLDQKTLAPRRLVGPPVVANGLIHAAFGPDGTLYAMEDDATRDGVTILAISPHGDVTPALANHMVSRHARQAGPLALHPVTGDIYFAYGPSVYQLSRGTGKVETVATAGRDITALAYRPGGTALVVGDAGAGQVVELLPSPPNAPTLQVEIGRGYSQGQTASGMNAPWYKHHLRVTARDSDGAEDIAEVTIVDPEGEVHTLAPNRGPYAPPGTMAGPGDWAFGVPWGKAYWRRQDAQTVECLWARCAYYQPIPRGQYTITVTDRGGNATTVTTPTMPSPEESGLELLSPRPGSAVETATPTFAWRSPWPDGSYRLEVCVEAMEPGGHVWDWSDGSGTQTAVSYNADGRAASPSLVSGRMYTWAADAAHPVEVSGQDPRVQVSVCVGVWGEFAVYQDWPERPPSLPGKLVYQVTSEAGTNAGSARDMMYSPDPSVRLFPGPSGIAHWSPDGRSVLYDGWMDPLDLTPPVLGPRGLGEVGYWAPEGQRMASDRRGPFSPFVSPNYDIWVVEASSAHAYPLVHSIDSSERSPTWSADGLWIAYDKQRGPVPAGPRSGFRTWLVRYDGADDHPLVVTGVAGYEGYRVTRLMAADWSPTANILAVTFAAQPEDSRYTEGDTADPALIWGVGTMSATGGVISPVFLGPPGAVCCAGPRDPTWSPDGRQLVFSSAHQAAHFAPPGQPELEVELWLINADGSGKPVRLTYDHLVTQHPCWWAPNTEPGSQVKVVKGDASATFETVTEAGCTSLVAYLDPPQSLPEGSRFAGLRYELATTAKVSGAIGLEIHYEKKSIPAGREHGLRLLHHEGDRWVDVTADPVDAVSDTIRGRCTTPGAFALAVAP